MIKAVIFDIDGVLIDSFEANLKFFQNLMVAAGYPSPTREEFPSLFHLSMMDVIKKLVGPQSPEEIVRVYQLGETRSVVYPVELVNIPDGADEIIKTLSEDYLLALATSRVRNSVYEIPSLAKLERYFRAVASYEDTENHKPFPDPLLYAAQKLGVAPGECVYIGDVENDIKAALAAGMKSILFSKENVAGADAHTIEFKKIPELIRSI